MNAFSHVHFGWFKLLECGRFVSVVEVPHDATLLHIPQVQLRDILIIENLGRHQAICKR